MENIATPGAAESAPPVLDLGAEAICPADLAIALANAALDPDGQVYPWLPGYPLAGATVVYDGRLWTVGDKERGPGQDESIAIVHLVGQGHDGGALVTRSELRPVTWSPLDEFELQVTETARQAATAAQLASTPCSNPSCSHVDDPAHPASHICPQSEGDIASGEMPTPGDVEVWLDAAAQVAHDKFDGEYVVVELSVGGEPEQGVEFDVEPDGAR